MDLQRSWNDQRRFWNNVDSTTTPDGCWTWKGADDGRRGYGKFKVAGRSVRAIRWVVALYSGAPVDPRHYVLHSCDNPRCVRPDHLSAGTPTENAHDMARKGRKALGEKASRLGPRVREEMVPDIREMLGASIKPPTIAKFFGVSAGAIYAIRNGRTWRHAA